MRISAIYPSCYSKNVIQKQNYSVTKMNNYGLMQDTVSFGAMKKSAFSGVDFLVVEKFKAPIETFTPNTENNFEKWVQDKTDKILNKNYPARSSDAEIQRKSLINEWKDYLEKENKEYTPAQKLLIYDGITKNLEPDSDAIPPVLSKGVLADTIYKLEEDLKVNPKMSYNFLKAYNTNLRNEYLEETNTGTDYTGWVKIPSKGHDSENFDKNVEKLKILSHASWCTKSYMAEPYLKKGDFHVYLENGKPKLGVRFVKNEIEEIQGEKNDMKIPQKYLSTFVDFMNTNGYSKKNLTENALTEYQEAKELKKLVNREKRILEQNGVNTDFNDKNYDFEKLFNYYGIKTTRDEYGMLVLSHFEEPKEISFTDLGINENNLFNNVSKIKGDAKFHDSEMDHLGNLREIEGTVRLTSCNIKSLGKLKRIGGDFVKGWDRLQDTGDLEEIGGNVEIISTRNFDFTNLKRIKGNFEAGDTTIVRSLGSIEEIDGNLIHAKDIEDFGNLRRIGGNADFNYAKIYEPIRIEEIGGDADFSNADIKVPLSIKRINGDFNCKYASIEDLGALEYVGGDLYLGGADIKDFGAIKEVKGKITALNDYKEQLNEIMEKNNITDDNQSFWDKIFKTEKKCEFERNSDEEERELQDMKFKKRCMDAVSEIIWKRFHRDDQE